MKKTSKKNPRASRKKAVKDLHVKPAKGATVRGGDVHKGWIDVSSFSFGLSQTGTSATGSGSGLKGK